MQAAAETIVIEQSNDLPDDQDFHAIAFEAGGSWDMSREIYSARVTVAVRSTILAEVRSAAGLICLAALDQWAAQPDKLRIVAVSLGNGPALSPKDSDGRWIAEFSLVVSVHIRVSEP